MSENTMTAEAVKVAELLRKLAATLNRNSDASIAEHARQAFALSTVHQLSFDRIAERVSRARVQLAREGAGLEALDDDAVAVLADDDAYRVSSSTVSSWVQAIRRLEDWGVTHTPSSRASREEKLAADAVIAASYRLGGRARSGDILSAVGVTVLAAPVLTRTAVATRELVSGLKVWRDANRGPAEPETVETEATEPETVETEAADDAAPVIVPMSAETLAAVILSIPADVAHMTADQLGVILSALDKVYDEISELPAYAGARELLAAV